MLQDAQPFACQAIAATTRDTFPPSLVAPTQPPGRLYGSLRFDARISRWLLMGIEPHVAIRLKRAFPKLPRFETKVFVFAGTDENCADLAWFISRYPVAISGADHARLAAGAATFARVRDETERILLPGWRPGTISGFRQGFVPYPNQERAIAVARLRKRLLCMDDVGLGKTETALGTIAAPEFLPAAIVVEAHLAAQWAERIVKRTHMTPHIINGTRPYGLTGADCYIFRYSNIHGWADIAAQSCFRSVVFDEIQSLRNGTATSKGRAASVFAQHAVLRIGLTATPIYNYGSEIFHVMKFIDPDALGEWDEFAREWCRCNGRHFLVNDPTALGTYLREQHLALREVRSGRQINKIVQEVPFDEEVERESVALARTLALKVTTGSFVERGQAARELDMLARLTTGVAKARGVAAVARLFLEAGIPIILAGWHRDVYEIWLDELAAFNPVMYTGSETSAQKDAAKAAFASGKTDLFIISLRSGTGIDGLQTRCRTVIVGEYDWSPKVIDQLIGRVDRPGQTATTIDVVYCHADGGSDPLIVSVLGIKGSQARGIVDPLAGVEQIHSDESRIKALAALYLRRKS